MTTTQININSAGYRADNPRAQTRMSREQERQYIQHRLSVLEDAGFSWTEGYKALAARLAEMEGAE